MQLKKILSVTLLIVLVSLVFFEVNNFNVPFADAAKNKFTAADRSSLISFSGYTWYVEDSMHLNIPGPNYWSNSPENVWVDENGWLHLRITNRNGRWYCAELTSTQTFGYGTYAFYTVSCIDDLDKNVVLGLFAYKDDLHEVDIEFTKWGISGNNNGWFTVQRFPCISGDNQKAFNFQLYGEYSTHYFTWTRKSIYFESFGGHYPIGTQPTGNIISSFNSCECVNPQGVRAHINLWLYQGNAPSDGMPTEVIIKSFQFTPLK